jgi:hypothetical protein
MTNRLVEYPVNICDHSSPSMSVVRSMLRNASDDVVQNITSFVILSIVILMPSVFLLSRMHMLLVTYNDLLTESENSVWLLQQCKHDEFYHNLKQHSSLCDDLSARQRDSILLNAMEHVIENSYMCGFSSCVQIIEDVAAWAMGRGVFVVIMLILFLSSLPSLLVPCLRRRANTMADTRLRSLHHAPYGHDAYVQSAYDRHMIPWEHQPAHEAAW